MRLVNLDTVAPLTIGITEAVDGNMALHTGDDPVKVAANRQRIASTWATPIHWMNQIHSTEVAEITRESPPEHVETVDALYTHTGTAEEGVTLAVLTADCLPVILYTPCGTQYAAVHAGWRGLLDGILINALSRFDSPRIHAYIGPAISQVEYQVPLDFKTQFEQHWQADLAPFFTIDGRDHLRADLPGLAQWQLERRGVMVRQSGFCTASEPCFFSYRRHKSNSRIATIVGPSR